jgi:hypothetical protein
MNSERTELNRRIQNYLRATIVRSENHLRVGPFLAGFDAGSGQPLSQLCRSRCGRAAEHVGYRSTDCGIPRTKPSAAPGIHHRHGAGRRIRFAGERLRDRKALSYPDLRTPGMLRNARRWKGHRHRFGI